MSQPLSKIQDVIPQFEGLSRALIDASSIIYMKKAGFLSEVMDLIELNTLPEILRETGSPLKEVKLVKGKDESASNDQKLISCARASKMPVISEDKNILLEMKGEGIPYFNALMMLNFLLFKKKISRRAYRSYVSKMKEFARYSQEVWDYGSKVYSSIIALQ